jgi:hypothetical protein
MERDWALVVGIDRYPLAGVAALKGAVRDAHEFHRWVTAPQGGAVPVEHTVLLTSPPASPAPDSAASADAVARRPVPVFSDILRFFENLLADAGLDGRRLYVYLSGHGISPTGQEAVRNAALLMANAKPPNQWHSFPGNIWAEGVRSSAMFQEVVLVMDCCRDLNNNATVFPHIFGDPVEDGRSCLLVEAYATGWASKARELPLPPDNSEQGVFTHSLLHVLRTGRMTGALLKESVQQHLSRLLQGVKRVQQPEIGRDDDLAKVVFNDNAPTPRIDVVLKGHPAKLPAISSVPPGGDLTPVTLRDWKFNNSGWCGTLEPGTYLFAKPDGGLKQFRVLPGLTEEITV